MQVEPLPALLQLFRFTRDEAILHKLVGTLDWINLKQRDQVYGEFYWGVWPDGSPDAHPNKGSFWKANYHVTHGLIKLRELLMADPDIATAAG